MLSSFLYSEKERLTQNLGRYIIHLHSVLPRRQSYSMTSAHSKFPMVGYEWVLFCSTASLISVLPDFSHMQLYTVKQLLYHMAYLFNRSCFSFRVIPSVALIFDLGTHPGCKIDQISGYCGLASLPRKINHRTKYYNNMRISEKKTFLNHFSLVQKRLWKKLIKHPEIKISVANLH